MPRASKAQADRNRAEIERVSSLLLRERGIGVSVADVMGAAGLTHGGFYKHFASKDDMTAAACSSAFGEAASDWKTIVGNAPDASTARADLVAAYLQPPRHRTAAICPMAALATDVSRSEGNPSLRESFRVGLDRLVNIMSEVQPSELSAGSSRENALADISAMVGALALSLATSDPKMADEILEATRKRLLKHDSGV